MIPLFLYYSSVTSYRLRRSGVWANDAHEGDKTQHSGGDYRPRLSGEWACLRPLSNVNVSLTGPVGNIWYEIYFMRQRVQIDR